MIELNATSDIQTAMSDVVKSAFSVFLKEFASGAGRKAQSLVQSAARDIFVGFGSYLQSSYVRCKTFKSVLNTGVTLDTIQKYIHVSLDCGSQTSTDEQLISIFGTSSRVVIAGVAGSGKSMLMRYATICHFENPANGIPLFLELRHFNALSNHPDLINYIRTTCSVGKKHVSPEQFDRALREGVFILLFDGFDELNFSIRETIQKEILELSIKYPKTSIIMSSRPDERFAAWSTFQVWKIREFTQPQVLKFISSLDYDAGIKRRFKQKIKAGLFETHKSFLTNPLLATIMLLTYKER